MATQPETTTATAEDSKAKTVGENMPSRRIFESADDAAAYIQKCQEDFTDFDNFPPVFVGATEDGDFDPEVYTDEMRIAVAVLKQRGDTAGATSTVKAIVIYPSPKIEAILATELGSQWLTAIMEKELNHVAVRQLRKAETREDIDDALESMPTTVADFITSNRETSGGILEAYNGTWQVVKKAIGSKWKVFANAMLSKKELRKGIESASYAAQVYPKLELRKNKAGEDESLFEIAANFGLLVCKNEGLDPAFFERALANRNEKEIDVEDDEDEEDFDLEAMAAAVMSKDEPTPAEPTGETADGEGES